VLNTIVPVFDLGRS